MEVAFIFVFFFFSSCLFVCLRNREICVIGKCHKMKRGTGLFLGVFFLLRYYTLNDKYIKKTGGTKKRTQHDSFFFTLSKRTRFTVLINGGAVSC